MTFASKLQQIRQENGISQEAFAELLGVSRQSVSKWERGRGYPEIDKLIFISEHFNISLDELLKDSSGKISGGKKIRERKPISLLKPEDSREIQEIYPSQNTFNHTVVSEPNNLAKYENYEFQQQSIPSSESGKRKTRRKIRKPKLFRYRKVIAAGLLGGVLVTFISVTALLIENSINSRRYYSDTTIIDDNHNEYPTKCMIDESTGTRYIFEAETDYGLAVSFQDEDPEKFIKLKEPSTGNTYYCHNSYYEECAVVTPENGHTYVIPDYMVYSSMETENQQYYEVCSNTNTNQWIFVPKYILELCEKIMEDYFSSTTADQESESNEFFEEEAEDEIAEETPENPEEQVYPYGDEPAEIN